MENNAIEAILCCGLKPVSIYTHGHAVHGKSSVWEDVEEGKSKTSREHMQKGTVAIFLCKHATNSPQRLCVCKTVSKSFTEHLC